MKFKKKGAIGLIIGGVLAVISSIGIEGENFVPAEIKCFGGIVLIIFGLSRLLLVYDNPAEQKSNRRVALLMIFLLLIGAVAYLYVQDSKPRKKEYIATYGTFEAKLNNRNYSGQAIIQGEKITLQFRGVPSDIKIDGFKLYNRNIEIEEKSIDMVCALMSDMRVIHCSTDLSLPKANFKEFVDRGFYTVMYWMREPLENIKINDLSFVIMNDNEAQKRVEIQDKK